MIVYGFKTKAIASKTIQNMEFPGCEDRGEVYLELQVSYFHLFWIPFIPYRKRCVAVGPCNDEQVKAKHLSEPLQREIEALKSIKKVPIWTFSGLMLFIALIVFIDWENNEANQQEISLLMQPQQEDLISIKIDDDYSYLKITEILEDTVVVTPNIYSFTERRGMEQIDEKENYDSTMAYKIAKTDLLQMHESGEIIDVERN